MGTINKPLFPMRIEDLPAVSGFLYNSLVRDVADFTPYTAFDAPFAADYLAKMGLVEAAVAPVIFINKLKVVTLRLITNTYGLRPLINSAEIYFKSAGTALNVLVKDMGQRQVRAAINSGDIEALIKAMVTMNKNIANNSAVLITKGFTLVKQTALVTKTAQLREDNDLQNTMHEQQTSNTTANMILYNSFWSTYASPTSTTGKLIYKESNKTKAKEYTVTVLMKRVRHDATQTNVFGVVKDAAGKPVNKAKVKLIPIDGGRTKTVYSDAKGKYDLSGMRATDYNMVVTKDELVKVIPVTVITRGHQEVNVTFS